MSAKPKKKVFATLLTEVVKPGLCSSCGGCVAACPVNALVMEGERPKIVGQCVLCEVCYHSCPQTEVPYSVVERSLFGRERSSEEIIGVYREAYSAKTKLEEVSKVAQDGGVVTTVLIHALKSGLVEAAVVAGTKGGPWRGWPMVALTPEEAVKGAGTKYTPSPNLIGLAEAVKDYVKSRVAFVGTPCQVRAVRQMQFNSKGCLKLGERVVVAIGLFCMESFNYEKLMGEFLKSKGYSPSDISKFAITKGKFIAYSAGKEVVNVPLAEVKGCVRESCHHCQDFTSELADLSVGSVGSPDGWSTVIVRTEAGGRLLKEAVEGGLLEAKPISEVKPGLSLVLKLSQRKREQAAKGT
ncbi:MAG: Coenzyme F420 hydrogenase/dehydrogenase, beta subunit C-terminal domain [Candidatus Nezhaarchaeota archaeon]|nr:Coenzyme F420 hydrogenase/dehydrogenase, beta subunit C-terminal domain [Candidatus Nezhaarchaeota archaeon]